MLAVVAQAPVFGVKVYVPEAVLLMFGGDQVPEIAGLFVETEGNAGAAVSSQKSGICANVGVTGSFTVIFMVVLVPHSPAFGVKVYVPEAVLLTFAGDHVPVMLLFEVVGKEGAVVP